MPADRARGGAVSGTTCLRIAETSCAASIGLASKSSIPASRARSWSRAVEHAGSARIGSRPARGGGRRPATPRGRECGESLRSRRCPGANWVRGLSHTDNAQSRPSQGSAREARDVATTPDSHFHARIRRARWARRSWRHPGLLVGAPWGFRDGFAFPFPATLREVREANEPTPRRPPPDDRTRRRSRLRQQLKWQW